jgi:hypothetical protein
VFHILAEKPHATRKIAIIFGRIQPSDLKRVTEAKAGPMIRKEMWVFTKNGKREAVYPIGGYAKLRKMIGQDTVYFILNQTTGLVKIGRSTNTVMRYASLSTAAAEPLEIIYEIHIVDGAPLERELHKRFSHLRQRGEWFQYSVEIKDFIDDQKNMSVNSST